MERLQATIVTDEDITSPALLATYTALAAATWQVTVSLSGLAGNGVYKAATRRQVEGAGAVYQSPTAFLPLAVGVSTGTLTTIPLPVNVDDVVEVWAEGLAGDVAVDGVVELFDVTAAAIAGVGAGSGTGYYSDTVDNGTSPLDGVRVQLYTAADRVGLAYEAYTNALGVFEMWPDPGTYYRWLDLAGYSFTQDVEVEVTEP